MVILHIVHAFMLVFCLVPCPYWMREVSMRPFVMEFPSYIYLVMFKYCKLQNREIFIFANSVKYLYLRREKLRLENDLTTSVNGSVISPSRIVLNLQYNKIRHRYTNKNSISLSKTK